MAITYKTFKTTLLDHGELIITLDSGEKYEVHKSDVQFHDKQENFSWDSGDEMWIVDGGCVESILVHSSGRMD